MKILSRMVDRYGGASPRPLDGTRIMLCTHATPATVEFAKALSHLGAGVYYVPIEYSSKGEFVEEIGDIPYVRLVLMEESIRCTLPDMDIIMEDGARMSKRIHDDPERYRVKDGAYFMEQTTAGIRAVGGFGGMSYHTVNIAESDLKLGVENTLSSPESILAAFMDKKSATMALKKVMILGYGSVGSGLAALCRAHGSLVMVVDEDPAKRALAASRGFHSIDTVRINDYVGGQDLIISCTSNHSGTALGVEQFMLMADGAIVFNAGSGTGEVAGEMLDLGSFERNRCRIDITKRGDDIVCSFTKMGMKKTVEILCAGYPVNLRHGTGTANEAMDFVFSIMLQCALSMKSAVGLPPGIHRVGHSIEVEVARLWDIGAYGPKPALLKSGALAKESRPWGSLSRLSTAERHLSGFSVARASFRPNSSTDGHYHLVSEEAYLIERGGADISVWNPNDLTLRPEVFSVCRGDYLTIPKGMAHRVLVTSDGDFVCLVIASPPFSFWDQFFPESSRIPHSS